ncbi:DASH family cryptochrome [Pedobacter sp. AW31-3R]|uniref:DASH family cryptochrome n=1 Tax=Pedobacter sp. AW31-3R TaxID=3445781 RepID=UPI003FA01249
MKLRKVLVWFRNDLRLHDNEMLVEAIAKSDSILPVYFFDPRYYEFTEDHKIQPGNNRVQFLIESVGALRESLIKSGGNLLIIEGKPEDHLPQLVEQYDIAEVYHHREVATKETVISSNVEDALWKIKVNLKHFVGHTLYNKEDLPFPIKDIPDVFAQFKKKTERDAIVKECFPVPEAIVFTEADDWGVLPEYHMNQSDGRCGGEQEGLIHLDELFREGADIYAKVSNRSQGIKPRYSSALSPWLALGCLSPRKVYWAIKEAERQFGLNANFNQLVLGLLWRDYFRFMFKKHNGNFLKEEGIAIESTYNQEREILQLQKWKSGRTENATVDLYMKELNASGFISHQARLLVATYLIHVMKVKWMDGAIYFEEALIDYSPASNWGNWAIVADGGKSTLSKSIFDLDKHLKILVTEANNPLAVSI